MKRRVKLIAAASAAAVVISVNCRPLRTSAATVADVIAHAYEVGMPEEMIQGYIAMGSGRQWTSEQCDQAIGALDAWADERDYSISAGTQTQQTAPAPIEPEEFGQLSIEEKREYLTALPAEQKQEYLDVMTGEEKNQLLKQLDTSQQVEVISSMLGFGEPFGYNFSIEDIDDGTVIISARDDDNRLVGVTVLGDSVEKTGKAYTYPVLGACGAVLLSAAGIVILLRKAGAEDGE